jgi:hypothetical protein
MIASLDLTYPLAPKPYEFGFQDMTSMNDELTVEFTRMKPSVETVGIKGRIDRNWD